MSDDDDNILLASEAPRRPGDLVLYDYFKHLTTLALLVLGGILTLALSEEADLKRADVLIVLAVVSFAGITSFSGASEIARAQFQGNDPKRIELYRKAAPAILSIGIGMFLMTFTKVLGE